MLSRGASLSSRGPRIFLIQGKEGIGKTRLLEEFRFPLQMKGVPFLIMDMLKGGKLSDLVLGGAPLNLVDQRFISFHPLIIFLAQKLLSEKVN